MKKISKESGINFRAQGNLCVSISVRRRMIIGALIVVMENMERVQVTFNL